jgi:LmbE family N-acetylglucosaminyl deacetylase
MPRCLIVAPHPDDEIIGAGIWISRRGTANLTVAHVTDGSPRDPQFARTAGFSSAGAYGAARLAEARAALQLAGVAESQCVHLGFTDQELHLHFPELIQRIATLLIEVRPEIVLTPAYEGGHPDHDSVAFAIGVARDAHPGRFTHREYRLYHAAESGRWETRDFLPCSESKTETLVFTADEQALKTRMASVFRTQENVLAHFQFLDECIRDAPRYDFTRPPHEGALLYESFGWDIRWSDWAGNSRLGLASLPPAGSGARPARQR